ncbi:SPOR domain-containing protein [Marinihelvus fidelis]|nr:SPOR domain-containing protein [Marinihelvus fidelis]
MSRLIVIALLAANLALLGYAAARVTPAQPVSQVMPQAPVEPRRWPAETPRIQLMAEMPAPATTVDPARRCWSVGPFETRQSRENTRLRLLDLADAIADRESEALVELGYWVTLPAYPSMADAVTGMQELTRAGLHDIAVVTDDTGDYRVSLGYFLQESNARRRRDQLRELGYEAETRLQREAQPRYWLDMERDRPDAFSPPPDVDASLLRSIPCGVPVPVQPSPVQPSPATPQPVDESAVAGDQVPQREALPDL